MMDKTEAIRRVAELRDILWENSRLYYVESAPVMSDFEYDHLMRELEDLEKAYPELATPDSPTRKVGSDLGAEHGRFLRRVHRYPMLSLGNTYSISEIEEFSARADKLVDMDFSYCCELKFDGTAICLTYRNGNLVQALTRGDGVMGDDVTENVRHISNVPLKLHGNYPEEFEIRGEVLMPYEAFDRLNADRILNEEPPFANPRNAASGSLKLLDPSEVAARGLVCTLSHIPAQSLDFTTHDEALSAAASWGLPVSDRRRLCRNIAGIKDYIEYWDVQRKSLPFATDGIVIKINEMAAQRELGYTAKSPRWAVAFKFKAEQACTKLLSISYQVGRTGAVTPVANLEPVLLSGTVIRRATLNNEDQMRLLDVRVGDYVILEKGGEIIPKITEVDLDRREPGLERPAFPTLCPDCGTPLVREEDEARSFCPNTDGCPQQIKGKLLHFMSRKAMNILAGESTVEQLYNLGLARTPADLYDLTLAQLLSLEGWKEKSARRFRDSLLESRKASFQRVLFSLGIRYVGETTAATLAGHFGDIDSIIAADVDKLVEVRDIGATVARSVYEYFRDAAHLELVSRLRSHGLSFSLEAGTRLSDSLAGKTIVISGNFSVTREEIKELIVNHGGKNSSSISSKTSFLLAGTNPGPEKMRKCEELGISVIGEDEFRRIIPDTPLSGGGDRDFEPTLFDF
ncbi:MAG: NAD-dependent DNA ligase LigA [Bacteroidales bacterium]|nr:NAD-dependent DNA ligase LigA [Bacteroidales bacterium]